MAERKPTNDTPAAPALAHTTPTAPPAAEKAAAEKPPTGAAAALAARREAAYPVTVTKAELAEAEADETLTDDERAELRNMVSQGDVTVSDR